MVNFALSAVLNKILECKIQDVRTSISKIPDNESGRHLEARDCRYSSLKLVQKVSDLVIALDLVHKQKVCNVLHRSFQEKHVLRFGVML